MLHPFTFDRYTHIHTLVLTHRHIHAENVKENNTHSFKKYNMYIYYYITHYVYLFRCIHEIRLNKYNTFLLEHRIKYYILSGFPSAHALGRSVSVAAQHQIDA